MSSQAHEQPTERDPERLYHNLPTTPAMQEQISKLALLVGTPSYLESITKREEGLFAFNKTPVVKSLCDAILNMDHRDAAFRFEGPKPEEVAHRYSAVLLLCRATLYTYDNVAFYIQRLPVNSEIHEAIKTRVREVDPEIEPHNVTADTTNVTTDTTMLLQSRTAPSRKDEATLNSDSVCLVLQNVVIEMLEQLVPFLLIARPTSKCN